MDWGSLLALPVLALVDSTSAGTLLLPAWLLLAPQVRPRAVLGYLMVVAVAYWGIGLALLAGADALLRVVGRAGGAGERPTVVLVAQLAVGVVLLVWALLPQRWRRRRAAGGAGSPEDAGTRDGTLDGAREGARAGAPGPGRLARWRDRAAGGEARGGLLVLAAVAVLVEAATMLPYLGAVTLLASTGLPTGTQVLVLAGYCLVMVAPALLLVLARVVAARRVEPLLRSLERWSRRAGGEALLWVAGIGGFLLAGDAVTGLGLLQP